MRFDLDRYAAWRRDHPIEPLQRDVESWMALEIERLREEAHDLRMMVDGLETAAHEERAAVVAWLRGRQEVTEWALTAAGYEYAADSIERGEHRREEEGYDPSDAWRFCEGCGCRKQTARARSWSDHSWCDDCTSRE